MGHYGVMAKSVDRTASIEYGTYSGSKLPVVMHLPQDSDTYTQNHYSWNNARTQAKV